MCSSVAIAYVMQKTPYVFPIIGGRKVEHLKANLDALRISLTDEHIKYIESILPFDPGFPNTMIVSILPRSSDFNVCINCSLGRRHIVQLLDAFRCVR